MKPSESAPSNPAPRRPASGKTARILAPAILGIAGLVSEGCAKQVPPPVSAGVVYNNPNPKPAKSVEKELSEKEKLAEELEVTWMSDPYFLLGISNRLPNRKDSPLYEMVNTTSSDVVRSLEGVSRYYSYKNPDEIPEADFRTLIEADKAIQAFNQEAFRAALQGKPVPEIDADTLKKIQFIKEYAEKNVPDHKAMRGIWKAYEAEQAKTKTADQINQIRGEEVDAFYRRNFASSLRIIALASDLAKDANLDSEGLKAFQEAQELAKKAQAIMARPHVLETLADREFDEMLGEIRYESFNCQNILAEKLVGKGNTGNEPAIVSSGGRKGSIAENYAYLLLTNE